MNITFLGGANTVTGSKFLLHSNNTRILIDCGMFQGIKNLRLMNWDKLPINPKDIDAVILTHAHLDHSGYLPILVRNGFHGKIFCTHPTGELSRILLMDAARIQEEDAEYANKKGFSKHKPALPLFSHDDVEKTLQYFEPIEIHKKITIKDFTFQLYLNGHILGSSSVSIKNDKYSVLFSGDLGRQHDPLMLPPEVPPEHDFIIMESTYGDKNHSPISSKDILKDLILKVEQKKKILLIPSFAVGRAQNLLYEISQLQNNNQIPKIPTYLNTPMGQEVMELYHQFQSFHRLKNGELKESISCCHFIKSVEQSKALNEKKGPMIIIAASGMLTGGRVLHHIKAFAGDPENIILLAGFQAPGTRGWSLQSGASEIKMHGAFHKVNAEVIVSDSFSAHADQGELLAWLDKFKKPPKKIFLVHGESTSIDELRKKVQSTRPDVQVEMPMLNQMFTLE